MTSLLTNNAALTALTTLKAINQQLDVTSKRVSTGQRVTDSADNAAYWSIATSVRTDNAALGSIKDSLGLGASAVDTAYNGLTSVLSDLQNLRAKLQTALQPGVDRAKVQIEIAAIQDKMKATASSSTASGQNWLATDSSPTNTAYRSTQSVVAGFSRDRTGAVTFSRVDIDVAAIRLYDSGGASVTRPASGARQTAQMALAGSPGFAPGGTADFSGTNEVAIRLTGSAGIGTLVLNRTTLAAAVKDLAKVTTDEVVSALNNQIAASSSLRGNVSASLDDGGRLRFETTATGAGSGLNILSGTAGGTWLDLGLGANGGTALYRPAVVATPYVPIDLSGAATKSITVSDGTTSQTVTLTAASLPAPANPAAVSITEIRNLLNASLAAQSSSLAFSLTGPEKAPDRLILLGASGGPAGSATITGPDTAAFGFTNGQTGLGATGLNGSARISVFGSDAVTTTTKGILDTTNPAGVSIETIDIANLTGTAGDATLSALITQVDKAIASVADAGTKLGANKTQIDGQKAFVDTLMKANDRTIGILVDADVEEESTKLKALQTQQQLAVQALGIANGASAGVLSLFR
ncbi:flagellin [Methylobacterium sp.]|uniref:flagellin N-terminal helical domain-containing protein n=1 Tax=Methylobacterium sp. TaxID=409 RepID=UPI0025E19AFE|nr:flagellin [Methylobacterium sp.]MBY0259024.1 flagellin [Methylobacterium sp.]